MNLDDVNTTIDLHFPISPFKEWTPSEYDMKYHYNTPRKQKKIQKDKEKYDDETRKKISYQETDKLNLKELCRIISIKLPADVSSLFFETIKLNATDLITKHQAFLESDENMRKLYYDSNEYYCVYNFRYYIDKCIDIKTRTIDVNLFNKFFEKIVQKNPNLYTQSYCNEILVNYKEYNFCKENDIVLKYSDISEAKRHELKYIVEKLYAICLDICKSLDDKEIIGWERESNWGVGGYYNGILKNIENKRVSFKSFMAGGYNIQRRHIRCRLTILKNK